MEQGGSVTGPITINGRAKHGEHAEPALRTLGTLTESLPKDTSPSLPVSMD